MKSWVRRLGENPCGASLCIAALVVTTQLKWFMTNCGTLSQ